MKIMGWNKQGIRNASTVGALRAQIKRERIDIIFLCETKALEKRMDEVIVFVGLSNKLVVDAKGIAGGLCLMWKVGTSVNLVEFNKNLIAVTISDVLCKWILVCFYKPPYESKKKKAWVNLMALLESLQDPWVCMGDFNYTISENEKFGGKKGGSSMNNYFQDLLFEFRAIDLGSPVANSHGPKEIGEGQPLRED